MARAADRLDVDVFDALAVAQVVAQHQRSTHAVGGRLLICMAPRQQPLAPALKAPVSPQLVVGAPPAHAQPQGPLRVYQVGHHGALNFHGEVETRARTAPVVRHVFQVVQNIDAAHETDAAVDHAGLAMHAAQPAQVEVRPPQTPGLRAIDAMPDTGLGKAVTYVVSGFAAAEAIEHHPHLDTALFGARQGVDDAQAGVVEIEDV